MSAEDVNWIVFYSQLFGDICYECNKAIVGDGKSKGSIHFLLSTACNFTFKVVISKALLQWKKGCNIQM